MRKKFFTYALISSPLLALFGAGPFYVFGVLTLPQSIEMHISVLLSVVIYWAINGYIFLKLEKERSWSIILFSYFITFFSNVIKAPFQSFVEFPNVLREYLLYPILMTIALNSIILLIINLLIEERAKRQAQDTIAQLNLKKLEAENQSLMQQLQPHFLFNALSVLKSLIKEDEDLAEDYTIKLSEFLRYTVDSHHNELVSVASEMQFVYNYIDLQKIRFEQAFEFHDELPTDISQHRVPVLAIQTLVENAFKHNYFTEKRPLLIRISYQEGALRVWNNIVSLKVTPRRGTGLVNLNKRYQFIAESEIKTQQTEDAFSVTIPLIAP